MLLVVQVQNGWSLNRQAVPSNTPSERASHAVTRHGLQGDNANSSLTQNSTSRSQSITVLQRHRFDIDSSPHVSIIALRAQGTTELAVAMLSAFTARPIIELKQRDKSKIESILAYGTPLSHCPLSGALPFVVSN